VAKKHMEKCSPYIAIKEMQIKTRLSPPYSTLSLLEWLSSRTAPTTNAGKDAGKKNPHTLLEGVLSSTALWKTLWRLLKN
jgi:hypothetical protein